MARPRIKLISSVQNGKYTADFEVYGEKSQNGENSEVAICIGTTKKILHINAQKYFLVINYLGIN